MKLKTILILFIPLIHVLPFYGQIDYTPTGRNRMAAEWEPALGAIITWPLSIPHQLVIELAKDSKLFVMVADDTRKKEAVQWFAKWQIDPRKVKFIKAPQGVDASWTRDWGPHAVFTEDGTMKLADGKYIYATPLTGLNCDDPLKFLYLTPDKKIIRTDIDDKAPEFIALASDIDILKLPFAFTGGNVISDGQQSAFSTCVIINENLYDGETEEKFLSDTKKLLGINQYNIISNFETDGIQHIDCFMKMLDEERLFVMRPPEDHPSFHIYEDIVTNELSKLRNAYGRPYQILRLDTDRFRGDELAAYSNSLILNKTVYVPLYGIKQDSVALAQWAAAMPGYKIKGFDYVIRKEPVVSDDARKLYGYNNGWNGGDALHCRTRAMWDPQMLYMSVDRLPTYVQPEDDYPVYVIIKDYSRKGLINDNLKLSWRVKGSSWNQIQLQPSGHADIYKASIPGMATGTTIEYYISAKDKSGRSETMPRTAPQGVYIFSVL